MVNVFVIFVSFFSES